MGALESFDGNDGCGGWGVRVVIGRAEGCAEGVDGLALEAESDVGVDAGGDADVGVAEEFLDDDEVDAALFQEQGGGGVAEIVEADRPEPGLVEEAAEAAGEVARVKGVPLTRAAARRRSVTAARSCLPPRWRRPPTTWRAEPGSVSRTISRKPRSDRSAAGWPGT